MQQILYSSLVLTYYCLYEVHIRIRAQYYRDVIAYTPIPSHVGPCGKPLEYLMHTEYRTLLCSSSPFLIIGTKYGVNLVSLCTSHHQKGG